MHLKKYNSIKKIINKENNLDSNYLYLYELIKYLSIPDFDFVELYNKDFDDRFKVLLTANYKIDIGDYDEISEISINSPIGEAIFGKKAGDHTSYKVNNRNFDVEIVSFERSKTIQQNDQRQL